MELDLVLLVTGAWSETGQNTGQTTHETLKDFLDARLLRTLTESHLQVSVSSKAILCMDQGRAVIHWITEVTICCMLTI